MTEELELIRGSGNVFRDFGHPNADVEQLKSILAAKIIGILDDNGLSIQQASRRKPKRGSPTVIFPVFAASSSTALPLTG